MDHKYKKFKGRPLAYFCAEYALFDHDPLYAGGLGVLAGDYILEMIEQNFPVVALGLFYHKNDVRGTPLSKERKSPSELGLSLLKNPDDSILKIQVKIKERIINVQVWSWKEKKSSIYLLDTQVPENSPGDWNISDTLYVDDRYLRLMQEIILGLGGIKLLKKLNIKPSVYHLNEGHCAFMTFELIKQIISEKKVSFAEAFTLAKRQIVFTNHTLVPAGQEMFDFEIVKSIFGDEYANLGLDEQNKMFSMTKLALSMSCKVNAVSKIHEKAAREQWLGYNVESITNGINISRWDSSTYYSHLEQKRKLLELIRKNNNDISFNENSLLIGWARRFVEYKRPLAIFGDILRLKELAIRENEKINIVFSCPMNLTYEKENTFMREFNALMNKDFKGIVAFIPNYDIEIAKLMVCGCDVWLNTPIVGYEACGTSGMKACLNGALPLTTSDGWVDEVDLKSIGWVVADNNIDSSISKNLLDKIENEIVPEYYDDKNRWDEKMRNARDLIIKKFSTKRMLDEYVEKLYEPILKLYP